MQNISLSNKSSLKIYFRNNHFFLAFNTVSCIKRQENLLLPYYIINNIITKFSKITQITQIAM